MVNRCMSIALSSAARKIVFLTACFLFAAVYLSLCTRHFLAAHFSSRPSLQNLLRATTLEPQNADYQYLLGRYYQWVAREPETALHFYQSTVALNPHIARYWFDLSSTYQLLGDKTRQDYALQQAILTDPTTPDIAWEAANLSWSQRDTSKALKEFRVVLESDASLAPSALERCWRIKPDVDELLRDTVPQRADVYSSFLTFLTAKNEAVAAAKVWSRLIGLQQPVEQRYVFDYVRFLIDRHAVEDAQRVWSEAGRLGDLAAYQPSAENLVINSDFSLPLLNAGFDWRYDEVPGVTLALDAAEARSAHAALSVAFESSGIEDAGIRQMIAVEPDSKYEFTAYFKAEDILGAGGPRLVLQDFYTGATCFASDDLKDAGFWKLAAGSFVTGPDTKLLLLRLLRVPAGDAIRGKLWIDDLHLTKVESVASVQ